MAFELQLNTGHLYKNENPKNEKSPPYTGKVNVGGVMYYQSAWIDETKTGKKRFSQKFTPMDDSKSTQKPQSKSYDVDEDSIPF